MWQLQKKKRRYDSNNKQFCEREQLYYLSIPVKIKRKEV